MDPELESVCEQVMLARRIESLLGAEDIVLPPRMLKDFLRKEYERFQTQLDPQSSLLSDDHEIAREASAKLELLYQEALSRIDRRQFGLPGYNRERPKDATSSFSIGANRYFKGRLLHENEWSQTYQGFLEHQGLHLGEVDIKVTKSTNDTNRSQNEVRVLEILHRKEVPQWKHLPLIVDKFTSGKRIGSIFRKISGYSLSEVHEHPLHKEGVDRRDVIWMLDRILSALGYVHRQSVVHGGLTPETILIQPTSHNVIIVDWSSAVYSPATSGERSCVFSEVFAAPEAKNSGEIGPWSDIYSIGKIMIWLLGGDPLCNQIPDTVEEPLRRFLLTMVKESRFARPADAWLLHEEETRIKDSLWERKFRHFEME